MLLPLTGQMRFLATVVVQDHHMLYFNRSISFYVFLYHIHKMSDELKNERKTIKSGVTRIANYVKDFKGNNLNQINTRNEKLEKLWHNYSKIQAQLELINIGYESDRDIFEKSYFDAKSAVISVLNKFQLSSGSQSSISVTETTHKVIKGMKLPRINIPTFEGYYQHWQSFRDLFESSF